MQRENILGHGEMTHICTWPDRTSPGGAVEYWRGLAAGAAILYRDDVAGLVSGHWFAHPTAAAHELDRMGYRVPKPATQILEA